MNIELNQHTSACKSRSTGQDGNGFIDKHELGEVMKSMGEEYDDEP